MLLPHATHGGKIIRGDGEQPRSGSRRRFAGGGRRPEKPLAFFQAEADVHKPRYANGSSSRRILNGWQTAKNRKNTPQTAILALDAPVELADGDELKIVGSRPTAPAASGSRFLRSVSIRWIVPGSTTTSIGALTARA